MSKLSTQEKIKSYLTLHGINQPVEIEKEAEKVILGFFESNDLESVYLDKEGGLMFEFRESDTAPNMMDVMQEIEENK